MLCHELLACAYAATAQWRSSEPMEIPPRLRHLGPSAVLMSASLDLYSETGASYYVYKVPALVDLRISCLKNYGEEAE